MKKLNLPNKLTMLRVLLVPFIVILPLLSYIDETNNFLNYKLFDGFLVLDLIVLIIFVLASFTDYLDGHIARKYNLVTDFGKFLDPLADKVLVVTTMLYLLVRNRYTGIINIIFAICIALVITREFAISGLRMMAASKNIVIAASKWGKFKTVSQMVMIIIMLLNNYPFEFIKVPFDLILLGIATILTIVSGVDYFIKNKSVIKTM